MSTRRSFEDIQHLVARGIVVPFKPGLARIQATPTVFFGSVPERLLDERRRLVTEGTPLREWYLLTDEPLGEWVEDLKADFSVFALRIRDLRQAKLALTVAASDLLTSLWRRWSATGRTVHGPELRLAGAVKRTEYREKVVERAT